MSIWFFFLCQLSVVGYALLGGAFLAFSDFIMRSLAHTNDRGGIEAMQIINREVFRYVFMALFIGLVPVSLVGTGYAIFALSGTSATLVALSGMIYLVGSFGVTLVFNVPLNEAVARMDLTIEDTQWFWSATYLPRWTFWNSVRTAACTAASACLPASGNTQNGIGIVHLTVQIDQEFAEGTARRATRNTTPRR